MLDIFLGIIEDLCGASIRGVCICMILYASYDVYHHTDKWRLDALVNCTLAAYLWPKEEKK